MKTYFFALLAFSFLVQMSCQQPGGNEGSSASKTDYLKEIVTTSYTVKMAGTKPVKDVVTDKQSTTFNAEGLETAQIVYDLNGQVQTKNEYLYNANGQRLGSSFYGFGDRRVTSNFIYDLDAFGRKVSFREFDFDTDTIKMEGVSQFSEDGKVRKDGFMLDGKLAVTSEHTFDDAGKEIEVTQVDVLTGQPQTKKYKYTNYSKDGLWSVRQIIQDSEVIGIEEREFKY